MPGYEADAFQEYGNVSVNNLAKHFFPDWNVGSSKTKTENLLVELFHMKYQVNDNIKKMITTEVKS